MSCDVARRETLRKFKLSTFPAAWAERPENVALVQECVSTRLAARPLFARGRRHCDSPDSIFRAHLLSRLLTRKCIHPDNIGVPADREKIRSAFLPGRKSSFSKIRLARWIVKGRKANYLFGMDTDEKLIRLYEERINFELNLFDLMLFIVFT